MLRQYGSELVDACSEAVGPWVQRCVERVAGAWDESLPVRLTEATADAACAATAQVTDQMRALVALDVEEQWTNPLAVLRAAVAHPTAVLAAAGVPPVVRDEFAERAFPDDPYDLSPASFADVDPSLHEPGLTWGAAKAHVVISRHH